MTIAPVPVSVVVPVYNGERTVARSIQSLLRQEYPRSHREFLFVDNASTDSTSQILSAYRSEIRVVFEPKRGAAAARNAGIRAATHSLVAFTDADCVADGHWLRHLVAPLADRQVGISGGNIRAVRPCSAIQEFGEWLHDHNRAINIFQPPYAITMNWASPRGLLLQLGGFDEALARGGEDADLSYRIVQAGYRIVYQHSAIVYHHNRSTLADLFREGFRDGFCGVKVLKKHRGYLRQFGYKAIYLESYKVLAGNLLRLLTHQGHGPALYDATFNCGKKAGKLAGSIRFAHLSL